MKEGGVPGEISHSPVGVAGYRGAPRKECEHLLRRLCDWIESFKPEGELQVGMTIIKAVLAHLYLAWIHPFIDGNGRTARLLEFRLLFNGGVPAPAAHLLSNHYNKTRAEYYRQLDLSSKSPDGVMSFLFYAVQGFRDGLREQIKYVVDQQVEVLWRDYVRGQFHEKTEQDRRRRQLALDLSKASAATPRADIQQLFSGPLHALYARKTARTLDRDLSELVKAGVLRRTAEGYAANKDRILAFRAPRKSEAGTTKAE